MSRLLFLTKLIYLTFLSSGKGGRYTCQVKYASVHSWGCCSLNVKVSTRAATMASLWRRDLNKYLIKVISVQYFKTAYLKLVCKCSVKNQLKWKFLTYYVQYTTFFKRITKYSSLKMQLFNQIMMCLYLQHLKNTYFKYVLYIPQNLVCEKCFFGLLFKCFNQAPNLKIQFSLTTIVKVP